MWPTTELQLVDRPGRILESTLSFAFVYRRSSPSKPIHSTSMGAARRLMKVTGRRAGERGDMSNGSAPTTQASASASPGVTRKKLSRSRTSSWAVQRCSALRSRASASGEMRHLGGPALPGGTMPMAASKHPSAFIFSVSSNSPSVPSSANSSHGAAVSCAARREQC